MPTNNQAVKFIGCSSVSYKNLASYNENTLYFLSDTQQIFLGSKEYTKSIGVLDAQPNAGTIGENGRLYVYNGNLYMCQVTGFTYTWTRIANVNDREGTVTSVAAGSGLTGGTITDAGTIGHAVPSGAGVTSDTLTDEAPAFGGSFQIAGVKTDEFGHVTGVTLHEVTLPSESVLAVSGVTDTKETLNLEGEFEVVIAIEKGTGSHDLKTTKKTFKLPKGIDAPTYSAETGDAPGSVKLVCSDGTSTEAVVKDWNKLVKITDITSIFQYKGTRATMSDLPIVATVGDVYYVVDKKTEYVYLGDDSANKWEEFGPAIDLSIYALASNVIPRVTGETGKVPVFASDGTLASSGHTLEKDVPANAEFTDTVYTHPTHTAHGAGLYKVTIDAEGHVSNAAQVEKSDITDLGIPAENTDSKVKTTPNTTSPIYLAGTTGTTESTGELAMNPNAFVGADGSLNATAFHGEADSAVQATKDANGAVIADTYETKANAAATYATKAEAQNAQLVWQVI